MLASTFLLWIAVTTLILHTHGKEDKWEPYVLVNPLIAMLVESMAKLKVDIVKVVMAAPLALSFVHIHMHSYIPHKQCTHDLTTKAAYTLTFPS